MTLIRRLRLFLFRDCATRNLEEEMRLHRELRAAALGGPDAATNARRRFGNSLQHEEASRDAWGWTMLDELRQDLRYAMRRLRQRPGFSASVIVVLALGIGATTAMFSAVDAAMLRPLPFPHAERLVTLPSINVPFDQSAIRPRVTNYHMVDINDVAGMHDTFSHVAAWAAGGLNLSGAGHPMRLNVGVVTSDFFPTLGVGAVLGRTFLPAEGKPGGAEVVILSYGLWRSRFGGADVRGQIIRLNDKPYRVIGVMPRAFVFPAQSDVWIPMSVPNTFATLEPFHGYLSTSTIARILPGTSATTAAQRLLARWHIGIGSAARRGNPPYLRVQLDDLTRRGAAIPLQYDLGADRRTALLLLLGATALLLLIACANVTNLLLAQAIGRRREVAMRQILGARRGRIARQFLTESLLLALSGTAAGLMLAPLLLRVVQPLFPAQLVGVAPARLDLRVLAFAAITGLVVGVSFGTWPALHMGQRELVAVARTGGDRAATSGQGGARRALVAFELAMTVTLLIGAGLMLRSFESLLSVRSGVSADHVGTMQLAFATGTDTTGARRLGDMHRIIERLEATPGIVAAGVVNNLPLSGNGGIGLHVTIDGSSTGTADDQQYADYLIASADYFRAMDIPLRGRTFAPADSGVRGADGRSATVAIISETMARRYWPGRDPIGRNFATGQGGAPIIVIGVVGDVRARGLADELLPQMYFPVDYDDPRNVALVARGTLPSTALLAAMRSAVHAVDPELPVFHVNTMDAVVSESVSPRRTNTVLISLFATIALLLATAGVWAVVSHIVAQRTREFGIRAALGASHGDLVWSGGRGMLRVVVGGVGIGTTAAWVLTRLASSLLYGVTVHDSTTFVVVPVVLLLVALTATVVPAMRAARVNPADVMRAE